MSKKESNNKLKPVLIVAVIFIWGGIIFRVVGMFSSSGDNTLLFDNNLSEQNHYKFKTDSFSIAANYSDPFLSKRYRRNTSASAQTPVKKKKQSPKIEKKQEIKKCAWPNLVFGGLIHNNENENKTALLQLNGKKLLVKNGDIINDITIVSVTSDSVLLKKDICSKTIYRR